MLHRVGYEWARRVGLKESSLQIRRSIIRKSSTASRYPAGRLLGELVFADRGDAGLGIGELQDRVAAAAKACVKSLSGRVLTAPSVAAADCDLHGGAGRRVFVGRGVED